jgi:5-methylcytosine-specific restriction enzyme subunit McrC
MARLDGLLDEIAPSRLAATDISRLQYNRLNSDYQPLHALCRLFLEGASLFEDEGDHALPGFLIDMNSVFERFVTEVLRQQCPIDRSVAAQDTAHLDEERRVRTIPDIVLRAGKRPTGVADCKYKRLSAGDFINPDLFQLLTYCIILPVTRGLLIYPRHLCSLEEELQVRSSPIRLRLRTLDLGRPWPEVQINCRELAEATFGWLA